MMGELAKRRNDEFFSFSLWAVMADAFREEPTKNRQRFEALTNRKNPDGVTPIRARCFYCNPRGSQVLSLLALQNLVSITACASFESSLVEYSQQIALASGGYSFTSRQLTNFR